MLEKKYNRYLKKIKVEKRLILISQISIIVIFLLLWQLSSDYQLINSFIFSSPLKIIKMIGHLLTNGNLLKHLLITLQEIIIAFSLGFILSFITAIIMYEIPFVAKMIEPFLTMINSLPKVALGPIIIIWVGANTKAIIFMALLINLVVSILTIYNGFIKTDYTKIIYLKSLNATRYDILTKLVLKSSKSDIIASLKMNISMTLIGVIMGEFLVSKGGIGYLIIYGTQIFNLTIVLSGILILILLSYLLYLLIRIYEKNSIN